MFVSALLILALAQQPDVSVFGQKRAESFKAYRSEDYKTFLELTLATHQALPTHIGTIYNLALAYALNEEYNTALGYLEVLSEMGIYFDIAPRPQFAGLQKLPGYHDLLNKFQKNLTRVGNSEVAFTIDESDLYPEGIVYDAKSGDFLIGSIHQRKILRVSKDGSIKTFANEDQGLYSVLGMTVDPKQRRLLVCTSSMPQTKGTKTEEHHRSALFIFNLDNAKLLAKHDLVAEGEKHNLGDLILANDGSIYLTDSSFGAIYKLGPNDKHLQLLVKSPWLRSPQGICLDQSQKSLIVGDYTHGLLKIDLKSKEITTLSGVKPMAMGGIDGLYYRNGQLIAIQNGVRPHRVIRWTLNSDETQIIGQQVLATQHPDFDEPTLGTIVDNEFYFVGNSQWGKYTKDHQPLPLDQLKTIKIFKLLLK